MPEENANTQPIVVTRETLLQSIRVAPAGIYTRAVGLALRTHAAKHGREVTAAERMLLESACEGATYSIIPFLAAVLEQLEGPKQAPAKEGAA